MSKLNKVKLMLQKILVELNSVVTDKGTLIFPDEELAVGVSVMIQDEEGNQSSPEDGKYYLGEEDGRTLVIENGVVTEIIVPEPEQEEQPVEEPAEEEMAEEQPVEEDVVESIVDEIKEVAEDVVEDANEEQTDEAAQRITDLEALVEELKTRIAELENKPADVSAKEQFKKQNKNEDKLSKLLNAKYAGQK